MRFITDKTSATGNKFAALQEKMDLAHKECCQLAKELGFIEWRIGFFCVAGGISSVKFPDGAAVDVKNWKKVRDGEWAPRLSTKAGKAIDARFNALPVVTRKDLNACIGWPERFKQIGFNAKHKQFYGIIVQEDWEVKMPADCTEITVREYNKYFPTKKKKHEEGA